MIPSPLASSGSSGRGSTHEPSSVCGGMLMDPISNGLSVGNIHECSSSAVSRRQPFTARLSILGPAFFPPTLPKFSSHQSPFLTLDQMWVCNGCHPLWREAPWLYSTHLGWQTLLDLQSYVLSTPETVGPAFFLLYFTHRGPQVSLLGHFLTNELSDSWKH